MNDLSNISHKIVYETLWVPRNLEKDYPHGWGFSPPLIEFPENADPAYVGRMCTKLSSAEFECIGATPKKLLNGDALLELPRNAEEYRQWINDHPELR